MVLLTGRLSIHLLLSLASVLLRPSRLDLVLVSLRSVPVQHLLVLHRLPASVKADLAQAVLPLVPPIPLVGSIPPRRYHRRRHLDLLKKPSIQPWLRLIPTSLRSALHRLCLAMRWRAISTRSCPPRRAPSLSSREISSALSHASSQTSWPGSTTNETGSVSRCAARTVVTAAAAAASPSTR